MIGAVKSEVAEHQKQRHYFFVSHPHAPHPPPPACWGTAGAPHTAFAAGNVVGAGACVRAGVSTGAQLQGKRAKEQMHSGSFTSFRMSAAAKPAAAVLRRAARGVRRIGATV
jgi:hypothetical protein